MKTRDLSKVVFHKKAWKAKKKNLILLPYTALDTETEKGKAFVIGITDKDKTLQYELKNFDDFLNFIFKEELHIKNNFFYNLTYDTNALIKHLPYNVLFSLAVTDIATYKDILIKIIPEKCLIIKFNRKTFKFFDIAQFYNKMKLDTVGQKILGIKKVEFDVADLKAKRYFNDEYYRKTINHYLARDTEITYKLTEHLIKIAGKFMLPEYFYSQASFSQQYFLENAPRDYKLPSKSILNFGLQAYNGGRFEVFKKGTFKNVSAYDIRSAYPYQNVSIPSLDSGMWKKGTTYDEDAKISLFKVLVEGYSHISPIKAENKQMIFYPVGKKLQYINKEEYKTLKLYNYKIKVLECYHYYTKTKERPFTFLKKFYDEKERVGKKHGDYMFYKIVINGFYGKTIQLQEEEIESEIGSSEIIKNRMSTKQDMFKAGLLFNPVIAQEITGNTRSMLLNAVVDSQEDTIAFATDSIITTKKPKIKLGKALGDWDEEHSNQTFTSLGSGVYFFEGETMKFRGFGRGYDPKKILHSSTSNVTLPVKRSIKLKQTFKSVDKDLKKFNLIVEADKNLNLNFDRKRKWLDSFRNTNDVYNKQIESKPLRVGV